jgi:chromosome segregation protein
MLRLEKMEICGFKSFGDRTEVRFPDGVTAVVGPNGCGKSNIGDALNWVLGEQSAKMLRGREMADVIFSGSELRKPLGMAEVSLCFSGGAGLPGNDDGNVVVTRRLFRTGESEYELNGSRTRLKDIQELLRQARVGARTYATIEQGRIDQVLNAKPRERRALIEDAAGVSGYKHKRRLAELKLEATRANLLRVNDIVVEVQRQINSLKRQAAKARRYRRLREELRSKEFVRFAAQARELDAELARLQEVERAATDAQAEAAARLGRLEADLQQRRAELDQLGRRCREAADRVHRMDIEIDREESQIASCRERIGESDELARRHLAESEALASRHEEWSARAGTHGATLRDAAAELEAVNTALDAEQRALADAEREQQDLRRAVESLRKQLYEALARSAELNNRRGGIQEALDRSAAQRARSEAEQAQARRAWDENRDESDRLAEQRSAHERDLERLRAELADLERRLDGARKASAAALELLADAREREKSAVARLATLEDVDTRFAGVSDGVKRLLSGGRAAGIRTHGVVADYVEAQQEVEGAAEGYLQALLPAVILEDDEDARRAAELLSAQGAGRTTMICRTQPAGATAVGTASNGRGALPRELLRDRRVLGALRERLTLKASANGAVAERIGDAVLVDSLASALALHRAFPAADFLTPDGDVVYASGVIATGGRSKGVGLLEHRRRTETARVEVATASREIVGLRERVEWRPAPSRSRAWRTNAGRAARSWSKPRTGPWTWRSRSSARARSPSAAGGTRPFSRMSSRRSPRRPSGWRTAGAGSMRTSAVPKRAAADSRRRCRSTGSGSRASTPP